MRIGTWNLAGRWSPDHERLLLSQRCDVWLLTEVSDKVLLEGYQLVATQSLMAARRHWAAVLSSSTTFKPLPDPHPASAAAIIEDVICVSSVLPWRSAGRPEFWGGLKHAEKMSSTLRRLKESMVDETWPDEPLVWGGDWNQSLTGPEYAGTMAGRRYLLDLLDRQGLVAHTRHLRHRLEGVASIDHIAVPADKVVTEVRAVSADVQGRRLSDHDLYLVQVA